MLCEGRKVTKLKVMSMNVYGHPSGDRPKIRWIDCVKDDMRRKAVRMEMTSDKRMEEENMLC
jgi:hypothetical protein